MREKKARRRSFVSSTSLINNQWLFNVACIRSKTRRRVRVSGCDWPASLTTPTISSRAINRVASRRIRKRYLNGCKPRISRERIVLPRFFDAPPCQWPRNCKAKKPVSFDFADRLSAVFLAATVFYHRHAESNDQKHRFLVFWRM